MVLTQPGAMRGKLLTPTAPGGAFVSGSSSSFDGTSLIQRSVANGAPVIFVSVSKSAPIESETLD